MTQFPEPDPSLKDEELARKWERLLMVRGEVNKALDTARKEKVVGNSLEARLEIAAEGELKEYLSRMLDTLAEITMVSELTLVDELDSGSMVSEDVPGLRMKITPTTFAKCPRCWKHRREVGEGQEICHGCQQALEESGQAG
jgi:isoleucyl-tRNA synthetase